MMLEAQRRFGTEPVDEFLRALHKRFSGTRDATTKLFLEEADNHLGKDAESYVRTELYHKPSIGQGGPQPKQYP